MVDDTRLRPNTNTTTIKVRTTSERAVNMIFLSVGGGSLKDTRKSVLERTPNQKIGDSSDQFVVPSHSPK